MAKVYDLLRSDLVFVTPYERGVLARAGVPPRPGWRGSDHLEQHLLGPDPGHRVGVLLLPPLPDGTQAVPQAMVQQIGDAVRSLRATAKLVVAMSPWGYPLEQELLKARTPLPDILLGSGPGIGLVGNVAGGGKTAWVRSFAQGKAMSRIDILAWPEQTNPNFKWTEGQNIRMTLFGLTDQYQEDQQVLSLTQSLGTD